MLKKTVQKLLTIVVVILTLYAIASLASTGRFEPTHAITSRSSCLDCHMEALVDLNNSKHIERHIIDVGQDQSGVIDNYMILSNSTDTNGLCMSCHNLRYKNFGFIDPYLIVGSNGGSGIIGGIVFWGEWNGTSQFIGSKNKIVVTIGAQEIIPDNTSLTIDATIQLKNFSGNQNYSDLSTNIIQNIYKGETLTLTKENIFGDYFEVFVRVMGGGDGSVMWNFSSINITVDDYPMVIINSTGESYYTFPRDVNYYSGLMYFHTRGDNKIVRADIVDQDWRNASVQSISINNELMRDPRDSFNDSTGYTCNSPGARCHINQKMAVMGQRYGIGDGRYYLHETPYSTKTCENCHNY